LLKQFIGKFERKQLMKKLVYILGMLFIYATITYGQGITMTIGSHTASVGETVTIPISVTNLNNIGAVSLKIQYNPASLSYVGVINQPSSGNFTANASGGVLSVGWFGTSPLNIASGNFLEMQFVFNGGSSNIEFITSQCEIANNNGIPLVIDYVNGSVSAAAVTQLSLPQITAVAGNNISVPLTVQNLENVGAISLRINYDPAVLTFNGVTNAPSSGNFTSGAAGGVITLGWFDITPLNIVSGTLVNLEFTYNGNFTELNFNTSQCEISNSVGNPIFATYTNGRVDIDLNNVPKLKLGQVEAVPGSEIVVPLDVQKLQNIGAISLKVNYNTSVLTFNGVENAPTAGNFTANASGGVLSVGWFDTTPLNIDSAKFVDLKFTYISGVSDLTFNKALCEVSNALGSAVNAIYDDGKVFPNPSTVPNVTLPDVQAIAGNNVLVPVNVQNFAGVGAVSLKIVFDPAVLSFVGVQNQPSVGNFTANVVGDVVTIGWFDTNPFGQDSTKLVDIEFNYIGGTSALSFNLAQSEISNTLGMPLSAVFNNGKVSPVPGSVPKVSIQNITAAPGAAVSVPLNVNNFQTVGAVSLKIQYDPSVLSFVGTANQPSNGNFTANAAGGVITIGWFDTNPFGQANVKFADLQFNFIGGTSALSFINAQCEVSNTLGTPIFTEYENGSVSLAPNSYPVVKIANKAAKVGDTVVVPIDVKKLNDVGAISLKIQYNGASLLYVGTSNPPAAGNFTANAAGGIVTIGWFNTSALGIDSGKFANLRFVYNGGSSALEFIKAQCEIAKTNGDPITFVQYVNGSVAGNLPPQFVNTLADATIAENQLFSFRYQATDPNVDTELLYSIGGKPRGAVFDSLTGQFTWTPDYTQAGTYTIHITVSDGVLEANTSTVVKVTNVDRPPVWDDTLTSPQTTFEPNKTGYLSLHATDPDGDTVKYSFSTPPAVPRNASISASTGEFQWALDLNFTVGSSIPIRFRATAGALSVARTISFIIHQRTAVDPTLGTPTEFSLQQNYPNPFNPVTRIKYSIPEESKVVMKIYNVLGQQVAQLVNEIQKAGYYNVDFDASKLTSGIYLYKIEAKNFSSVKKMILVK
jgi:hypothetical protein